ncbi:tRNA (guanine(26)-N(2))-dimethyltransferase [Acidianus brierleyi]|uniref:tRNA (guanine(26)-N(2))-dimethyltransferase n=1 Tax=Acidianus brierleyi TaxID=41673 RepID=A0A2U9IG93_9CREN|nr:tRNA (guanine(26)-N(2))-dimethyltransferase [Acidianus brierleyi]AWR95006.1 tRNA (guanine(26)-N(2))-dimethyltransferase [Acidianus brierleyi]
MRLKEIDEGKAKLLIPDPEEFRKEGKFDPSWAPVFYNPRMIFNRDFSVVIVHFLSPKTIVDALSATGIRGIRYYLESYTADEIIFNDRNKDSVELIQKNIELNKVPNTKVFNKDANSLLYEIKSDFVDIDPFGSPSPFILSSINAVKRGGFVAYTATDLAPLEGRARRSCLRKYFTFNYKLSLSKEIGLRVLISKVIQESAIMEKSVYPLISYYSDYYYRVFFRVINGAKKADEVLEKLGFIYECQDCGYHEISHTQCIDKCSYCGSKNIKTVGPLWLGNLIDKDFVNGLSQNLEKFSYLKYYDKIRSIVDLLLNESNYVGYYNLDFLASKHKTNVPAVSKMIECLGDASRTHFDTKSIKTNKKFEDILLCIKNLSYYR